VLPHLRKLWAERGVEADYVAAWIELNDQWRAGAAAYGFPVVDVQAAWNGPDGKIEVPREYFVDDGGHLSPEGARRGRPDAQDRLRAARTMTGR